jgi:hypothetical protein
MVRTRDFKAAYRRRNQLARERGFTGYAQQRRFERRPSQLAELMALPQPARDMRSKALGVTDLAQAERISVEEAADRLGVPSSAVSWWTAERLGPTRRGRTGLNGRDALRMRPVVFKDSDRVEFAIGRGWKRRETERIFEIQWAAAHGMATDEELDWLRGRKVNGRAVVDTQAQLNEIARRGELDPDPLYAGLVS